MNDVDHAGMSADYVDVVGEGEKFRQRFRTEHVAHKPAPKHVVPKALTNALRIRQRVRNLKQPRARDHSGVHAALALSRELAHEPALVGQDAVDYFLQRDKRMVLRNKRLQVIDLHPQGMRHDPYPGYAVPIYGNWIPSGDLYMFRKLLIQR